MYVMLWYASISATSEKLMLRLIKRGIYEDITWTDGKKNLLAVNVFAGQKPKLHDLNVIEGVKLPWLLHCRL